jgi:hypothetical protein
VSGTDVQRRIRQTRVLRVAAVCCAALNAFTLAVNVAGGSPLSLILAPFSGAAVIGLLALIVAQTRMLGTLRRRERELSRPRMTAEDYRRLREMEIELGWEPSEPPASVAEPAPTTRETALPAACECGHCDGSHEAPAMRWFRDTRRPLPGEPPAPETGTAPMTGPGGRWRPVSELAEHDVKAAEHFAGLANVGRESCVDPCPFCAERDARSETMRQWLEDGRWEQR